MISCNFTNESFRDSVPYKTDRSYFCRYTNIMPYTAGNDKVKYTVHIKRYYLLKGLEEILLTSAIFKLVIYFSEVILLIQMAARGLILTERQLNYVKNHNVTLLIRR